MERNTVKVGENLRDLHGRGTMTLKYVILIFKLIWLETVIILHGQISCIDPGSSY